MLTYAGLVDSSISRVCIWCSISNFSSSFFTADPIPLFNSFNTLYQHNTDSPSTQHFPLSKPHNPVPFFIPMHEHSQTDRCIPSACQTQLITHLSPQLLTYPGLAYHLPSILPFHFPQSLFPFLLCVHHLLFHLPPLLCLLLFLLNFHHPYLSLRFHNITTLPSNHSQ